MPVLSKTSRHNFIDAIRGIAACLVMLQHSLYQSGLLGDWRPLGPLPGFIPNYLELGETGVVAFFIVSGFVIPLSLEKTGSFNVFWLHRVLRIYPLYLAVYFVTIILHAGGSVHGLQGYAVNFISHLLMIQEYVKQEDFVAASWTLSIEMVWYIGISILFLVALNKKTNLLVGISVAVSVVASAVCARGGHLAMGRLSLLLCCVLGLVCYRREAGELSRGHFVVLVSVLLGSIAFNLAIGFLIYPGAHPNATFPMARDSWALAAVIFFAAFLLRHHAIWDHSVLAFLGRISYSTYLVHGIILFELGRAGFNGGGVPFVLATFVLTLGASSLTYRFIEAPPIRYGRQLGRSLNRISRPMDRQMNEIGGKAG